MCEDLRILVIYFLWVVNYEFFEQAKAKRRFVLGLREVSKHLKLRKLKCVIISSNVERIKSAGKLMLSKSFYSQINTQRLLSSQCCKVYMY